MDEWIESISRDVWRCECHLDLENVIWSVRVFTFDFSESAPMLQTHLDETWNSIGFSMQVSAIALKSQFKLHVAHLYFFNHVKLLHICWKFTCAPHDITNEVTLIKIQCDNCQTDACWLQFWSCCTACEASCIAKRSFGTRGRPWDETDAQNEAPDHEMCKPTTSPSRRGGEFARFVIRSFIPGIRFVSWAASGSTWTLSNANRDKC